MRSESCNPSKHSNVCIYVDIESISVVSHVYIIINKVFVQLSIYAGD